MRNTLFGFASEREKLLFEKLMTAERMVLDS